MNISHSAFCTYEVCLLLSLDVDYFLNSISDLISVMVKCTVLFKVWTEYLNIIRISSASKGQKDQLLEIL